ncbi:hypothetical protein [Paenarthrobacter sp. PH39-S1]|uniref:hypothetical protein n=1 Tax=Paenarthrobacter sp. PH39-S1 TaxID=3046204 RepID=UPI0024B89A39|nr:hypothetical protein [Paenarthrobacter sp. PH39-S1]MDJ0356869.1 hypothetical protein [Paenarthrobacter sp. PH39-S1]
MTKSTMFTKSCLLAVSALLIAASTGCTNSEAPAAAVDASGTSKPALGEGGHQAAQAVTLDTKVQGLLPADVLSKGSMLLVTDPTYAPIDFTDNTGMIIGLDRTWLWLWPTRWASKLTSRGVTSMASWPGSSPNAITSPGPPSPSLLNEQPWWTWSASRRAEHR